MAVTLTEKETRYMYNIEKPKDKENIVEFKYYHDSLNAIYTNIYFNDPHEVDHNEDLNDLLIGMRNLNSSYI